MEPEISVPDLKLGRLILNHWTDWFFIIILIGLEILCQVVTPFQRYVGPTNFVTQSLKYPYKNNTVPFGAVPVIALVIPLVCIISHFFLRRNVRDLHHAVLGLLTTVALTAVITDAIKDGIGRPRPHFYARCFGSPLANATYDATGNVVCQLSASLMKESYKSFPSGHTSWSFAGLGYLAMYIAGKLGVFGNRQGHSWKLFPVVLPLLGATFVGVTRVDDYWHHWNDVFAGAAIGLLTAYFCYRQHYPSLFEDPANLPYPHKPRSLKGVNQSSTLPTQMPEERLDLERGNSQIPMIEPQGRR